MIDFIFRRLPFYILYVLSYGMMIVTLFIYGQHSPDHVYFLLFWLSIFTMIFSYIFYLFYEIDSEKQGGKLTINELKSLFYCSKLGFITPFFLLGTLSSINYIFVAIANPYVPSISQVLASVLQLPIVIIFNKLLNNEIIFDSNKDIKKQILSWFGISIFYIFGIILTSFNEINSHFEHFGYFLLYILSTIPLPIMSVFYQSLIKMDNKIKEKQIEMSIYSKPSLIICMLNFWQLFWLTVTIWILPIVDNTNIIYSFKTGLSCVFTSESNDSNDICSRLFLDLNFLTFCVIFNFYAGIKVVTFDDANFAILIQQLGPILAAFVFSWSSFMGQFYDNQKTTWRSYIAIISICISFVMYKQIKKYLSSSSDNNNIDQHLLLNDVQVQQQQVDDEKKIQNDDDVQSPKKKKTVFQRLWILQD